MEYSFFDTARLNNLATRYNMEAPANSVPIIEKRLKTQCPEKCNSYTYYSNLPVPAPPQIIPNNSMFIYKKAFRTYTSPPPNSYYEANNPCAPFV